MRARERISCSVGNVFNDLYSQLLFSFEIVFFMKVLELSASQAGLIVLIGQVSDALMSPLTGYLGDNVNVLFLSNKIGRRKSWHLVATVLMAISIPLLFNECFLCDGRDPSRLTLVYFGFFSALINLCFNVVEINHLAFITTVTENVEDFTTLTGIRTMFSFLSGVYVYAIAWALLGQDSGDNLGPKTLSDFAYLSWIATGTGVFFATIFYIGKKEPRKDNIGGHEKRELEVDQEDNTTALSVKSGQRSVASTINEGNFGFPNPGFAFECEGSDETEKYCSNDTAVVSKLKRSVEFSWSECNILSGEGEGKEFKVDQNVAERSQGKRDEEVGTDLPVSVSGYKHEVLDVPVSAIVYHSKEGRPKTVKDWLRDPNLYKVAVIFACSRLVYNTAYIYLPLFLTERLQFAKEAIAYFPLVLLVSASLSSILSGKLRMKIGTKWSYLLAASLVMGGSVWSYFQTPSTKQTTYGPVVITGFGMSIMYVMALTFITELIGENKETSGSVISIITIIARLSSGGLVFGIQEFYPEKDIDSSEAIGNYVQHVFVMAPGILTMVAFLLVLFFQPTLLFCKNKESMNDIEAQADKDESPPDHDDLVSQL